MTKKFNEKSSNLEYIVFFKVPSHWNKNSVRAYYYNDQGGNNCWPGELMSETIHGNIKYIKIKKELNMTNIIFNDGINQIPEINQPGFAIIDNCMCNFSGDEIEYEDKDSILEYIVFFKVPSHWDKNNVRAYYYNDQGGINCWPGELMSKTIYDDIKCIKIKKELNMTNIVFNDGINQIPEINQPGFAIIDNCLCNFSGDEIEYEDKDSILEYIVFFKVPSHWDKNNVRAYYYNDQGGNNCWPGELMSKTIYDDIKCIKIKKELNMTNIVFNDGINQIPDICQPGRSIVNFGLYYSIEDEKNLNENDNKGVYDNQYPISFTSNDGKKDSYKLRGDISVNKEINSSDGLSGNIGFSKSKPYIDLTKKNDLGVISLKTKGRDIFANQEIKNLKGFSGNVGFSENKPNINLKKNNDLGMFSLKTKGNDVSINQEIKNLKGFSGNVGFSENKPNIDLKKNNDLGMVSLKTKGNDVSINQEIKNFKGLSGNVGFSENKPVINLSKKSDIGSFSLETKGRDVSLKNDFKLSNGISGNIGFSDNKPSINISKKSNNSKINLGYDGNLNFGFNNGPCDFGLSCNGGEFDSENTINENDLTRLSKNSISEVSDESENTIHTMCFDENAEKNPIQAFITRKVIDLKGRNENTLPVLNDDLAEIIRSRLPNLLQEATTWKLLYSMDQHGATLSTLYRKIQGQGPCIMVLKNSEEELFGAFISEAFDPNNKGFFGTPECFLWKADPHQFKKFRVTNLNQYFMVAQPSFIGMGGGKNGNFGFYLDEDIQFGYSSVCDTYENEVLTKNNEFECYGCEIWGLEFK